MDVEKWTKKPYYCNRTLNFYCHFHFCRPGTVLEGLKRVLLSKVKDLIVFIFITIMELV